jgi:hypothetical protein
MEEGSANEEDEEVGKVTFDFGALFVSPLLEVATNMAKDAT